MRYLTLCLLLACGGQIEPPPLCHTGSIVAPPEYQFHPVDGGSESYEGPCIPGDRCAVGTDAGYLYGVCR